MNTQKITAVGLPRVSAFVMSLVFLAGLLTPFTGRAAGIGFTGPFLTCSISYNVTTGAWSFTVDPENIQAFQLDVQFDPTRAAFTGIDYVSPYVQTTPPDLGNLSLGWVQDVAGQSSISPPPPGDVDLFVLHFADLNPALGGQNIQFTVLASGNDFLLGIDPVTGLTTRYGSTMIEPMTCAVPEPSTYGLAGAIGLILVSLIKKTRRSKAELA